jgi:hypothetical protein
MQRESTKKNFLAAKGIKFQDVIWIQKLNVNHGFIRKVVELCCSIAASYAQYNIAVGLRQ